MNFTTNLKIEHSKTIYYSSETLNKGVNKASQNLTPEALWELCLRFMQAWVAVGAPGCESTTWTPASVVT